MSPGLRRDSLNALRQLRGARHSLYLAMRSPTVEPVLAAFLAQQHAELCTLEARLLRRLCAEADQQARAA